MNQVMRKTIGGVLLGCASTLAFAAGAGEAALDKNKATSGAVQSRADSRAGESSSSGASDSNPSQAAEPTGARGTEGRSGATTSRGPNDVVNKPKGMDQPAGSIAPDQNSKSR